MLVTGGTLTELEMAKSTPLPFPPEPLASIGIQATVGRWTGPTIGRDAATSRLLEESMRRSAVESALDLLLDGIAARLDRHRSLG